MLRGAVDQGTGQAVRTQFGVRADVAGKTGTTQENTDGWFILMHPRLVAGAWVGFNDSRITMRSDYWGQGAHNALLLVGDFFQHDSRRAIYRRAPLTSLMKDRMTQVSGNRFSTQPRNGWAAYLKIGDSAKTRRRNPRRRAVNGTSTTAAIDPLSARNKHQIVFCQAA